METNKPIETIRHGSIKAAIWANKSDKAENGEFYTVTFARVYRDGDALKDARSFGAYDLWPLVRTAASAYTWLAKRKRDAAQPDEQAA